MPEYIARRGRVLAGYLVGALIAVGVAAPASAAPAESPYPDIDTTQYKRVFDIEMFKVTDEDGIWFTTMTGLYCGIEADGSYGCSGRLPGAPQGDNEIGWFVGDTFPRLYHTDEPRFNSGNAQQILSGRLYIEYRGSRCAETRESGVYCIHGDDPRSQIMVTTGMTFSGPEGSPSS
jgi:hypothetical protein